MKSYQALYSTRAEVESTKWKVKSAHGRNPECRIQKTGDFGIYYLLFLWVLGALCGSISGRIQNTGESSVLHTAYSVRRIAFLHVSRIRHRGSTLWKNARAKSDILKYPGLFWSIDPAGNCGLVAGLKAIGLAALHKAALAELLRLEGIRRHFLLGWTVELFAAYDWSKADGKVALLQGGEKSWYFFAFLLVLSWRYYFFVYITVLWWSGEELVSMPDRLLLI